MKKIESFRIGVKGLQSNKMRAALTMLGIIFGVAAVIAMMSIGEGAKQETLQQIELLGTNNIIIKRIPAPQQKKNKKASFSPGLTTKDADAIKKINPLVADITPQKELSVEVMYKSKIIHTTMVGTTPNYPITFNTKILEGGFFNKYHVNNFSNVCVIGKGIKNDLFKFEDPINKKIKIQDLWFTIIGVTSPKNVSASSVSGIGIRNFNDDIYIPLSTMMYKTEKLEQKNNFSGMGIIIITGNNNKVKVVERDIIDQLSVKVKKSEDVKEAASLISRIMERRHYGVADYEIILPEQLLEQKQKTQRIFNVVMGAIAGISLLVGGIGIMNIMLANILERTREIGVRRAVGATRHDILNQFLYEALTISVAGGILGIFVGFVLTSLISTYAGWNTIISPFSVSLAFIVSVATGLIFGIYPAKQAADKNPIDSLRYE